MQLATRRDPLAFELIKNSLAGIADGMAVTVVRTARSFVVKQTMDFSTALLDANGERVGQGMCSPLHLGAMPPALAGVLDRYRGRLDPGDICVINDPYSGGSHLPDIFLFKPIFVNGAVTAFVGVIAHQTDIGGRVSGGNACDNTEIYQEGLRIPPLKLYERGKRNPVVADIIRQNVRVPERVLGDLLEKSLRRGLVLSDGDMTPFFTRPISAFLCALIVLIVLSRFIRWRPHANRAV